MQFLESVLSGDLMFTTNREQLGYFYRLMTFKVTNILLSWKLKHWKVTISCHLRKKACECVMEGSWPDVQCIVTVVSNPRWPCACVTKCTVRLFTHYCCYSLARDTHCCSSVLPMGELHYDQPANGSPVLSQIMNHDRNYRHRTGHLSPRQAVKLLWEH